VLPNSLIKGFDTGRLKSLLAVFFLALAVPTAVLIWQAYGQLKWEAFHQYRGMAEELTNRIDQSLNEQLDTAEARSFADYTFLVISGDPSANFVQRSPLSEFPVAQDLPGVIGYFQVGAEGEFSTPLLPQAESDTAKFGIGPDEYEQRRQLARQIQTVLRDNRLVRHQPTGLQRGLASLPAAPAGGVGVLAEAEEEASAKPLWRRQLQESVATASSEAVGERDSADGPNAAPHEEPPQQNEVYSQAVFDELNVSKKGDEFRDDAGGLGGETPAGTLENKERGNTLGKVADLNLDAVLQRKSELVEKSRADGVTEEQRVAAPGRIKRREQIALPESEPPAVAAMAGQPLSGLALSSDIRISTFESEVDPLEFSMLDSGHFVLFRKVWRNDERYIQGILIDRSNFFRRAVGTLFDDTGLADMSNLLIAYQDDVIDSRVGKGNRDYAADKFDGALLYRSRLSAPFDSLELIYRINGLPPGPGATVLGWVTLVLAIVFLGGFYTLYRLGLSQINLARQQQDFVSAVSHELKTPLTSIRMYGEMLKEGWAEPAKRQQYYEFIHDESERLSRLISNVLQLAKITRNEPQFNLRTVTVSELMSQIESKISTQVKRAGFALDMQKDAKADDLTIKIDVDCFAQIIINLVDNAIKFSRDTDAKRLEIISRLGGDDKVSFAVRDFGPGVPKNQMKKIFQLFYRSESELTRETVGTGIGLAIVQQLSRAMSGKVDVINMQPGAEFRVKFPVVASMD
jgi:signal transduction histidine kinase